VRPLGESGDNWLGRSGSGYVASRHLQGCSPCEQVLNVPIACRWYEPGKPSSLLLIDVWLSPLFYWLARERNWVWTRGSVSRRAMDCVGSPFSRERWLCPTLLMTHERLSHTGTAHRKRTSGIRGLAWEAYMSCWSGFPLQGVHRFKSVRLSDMSNRLFMAVIT
jgi:hypothetical protein